MKLNLIGHWRGFASQKDLPDFVVTVENPA